MAIVDKNLLRKLQGVNPCFSNTTFIPFVYDEYAEDEDMREVLPEFTIRPITNEEEERFMSIMIGFGKEDFDITKKKSLVSSFVENIVVSWSKLYDVSSGEEIPFNKEKVIGLTSELANSVFLEIGYINGIIQRPKKDEENA